MPEASVNEYGNPILRQNQVGGAGQVSDVYAIPKAPGPERSPNVQLRPGVSASYLSHQMGTRFRGRSIVPSQCGLPRTNSSQCPNPLQVLAEGPVPSRIEPFDHMATAVERCQHAQDQAYLIFGIQRQ